MSLLLTALPHYKNATIVEFMWVLSGLVGLALTIPNWIDSRKDYAAVRLEKINGDRIQAMAKVQTRLVMRIEQLRIVAMGVILLVGVFACFTAPSHTPLTANSVLVTGGFLGIVALEIAKSTFEKVRRAVLADIAKEIEKNAHTQAPS